MFDRKPVTEGGYPSDSALADYYHDDWGKRTFSTWEEDLLPMAFMLHRFNVPHDEAISFLRNIMPKPGSDVRMMMTYGPLAHTKCRFNFPQS